jgi:hypothetical protein
LISTDRLTWSQNSKVLVKPPNCPTCGKTLDVGLHPRETVAIGQTREKSRIEFPIAYLRCRNTKADTCQQSARVVPAPKVQIIAPVISSCRARERLFLPALG